METSACRVLYAAVLCVPFLGCTGVGQCGGYEPGGVGGGPIGRGGGGFGDGPGPRPQDAADYPSEGCANSAACEEKCTNDYDKGIAGCQRITDPTQRETCSEGAENRYVGCKNGCAAAEAAGEKCRQACQEAKDERDEVCRNLPKKKREKCWRDSNEKYANCAKKCKAGPQ